MEKHSKSAFRVLFLGLQRAQIFGVGATPTIRKPSCGLHPRSKYRAVYPEGSAARAIHAAMLELGNRKFVRLRVCNAKQGAGLTLYPRPGVVETSQAPAKDITVPHSRSHKHPLAHRCHHIKNEPIPHARLRKHPLAANISGITTHQN